MDVPQDCPKTRVELRGLTSDRFPKTYAFEHTWFPMEAAGAVAMMDEVVNELADEIERLQAENRQLLLDWQKRSDDYEAALAEARPESIPTLADRPARRGCTGMSNRIKVVSVLNVYEVDGNEVGWASSDESRPSVIVRSHRVRDERVCFVIDDGDGRVGHEYTVIASDLEAAIKNARNAG